MSLIHAQKNFSRRTSSRRYSEATDLEVIKARIKAKFDAKKQELSEIKKKPKTIPIYVLNLINQSMSIFNPLDSGRI